MWLDHLYLYLSTLEPRAYSFVEQNKEKWLEQTIVPAIRQVAIQEKMPNWYLAAVKVSHGKVVVDDRRAIFVEVDTRAHDIYPTRKMYLRWVDKLTRIIHYAPWVWHPGTTGKHIVARGWEQGAKAFLDLASKETKEYLEQLNPR